ncbi:hypothetical protein JTB14_007067 [Gonioctena quinquepunctata]|nr:hypothetical protein JTB14_007067 [Gonioctena quinquepunctata]
MLNGMENISKDECSGSKDESNYIEIKTNILKFNVSDDPSLVPKNSSNLGENVYVEDEEVARRPVNDLSQSTEDDGLDKDRNLEEVIEKSTKSGRILKKPNWMSDFVFDDNSKTSKSCNKIERTGQENRGENDPIYLKEALNGNNRFLLKNRTWNFIEQPENIKAIKTKWVFKTKYNENDLKETVYMEIPEGYDKVYHILREKFPYQFLKSFTREDGFVCKLNKNIYGLHQSGLMWNKTIDNFIKSQGFKRSVADPCVYHKFEEGLIITIYVDDILILGGKKNIEIAEIQAAEKYWIKESQCSSFHEDIQRLKEGKPLHKKSRLKQLNAVLDEEGILILDGRTNLASCLEYHTKKPFILSPENRFTVLLLQYYHAFEIAIYNRVFPRGQNKIPLERHGFISKRSTITNLSV